jgi:adenosylcobinamide-GDP ribazoletransferase
VRGLLGAVSFLTRVPVGGGERRPEELAGFVPWFPVVGAGVGLAVAGTYAASRMLLPPLPAATVAVVAGICLTGAFHEDGLGDTADAFAGGWDRDSTVRILKDPRPSRPACCCGSGRWPPWPRGPPWPPCRPPTPSAGPPRSPP